MWTMEKDLREKIRKRVSEAFQNGLVLRPIYRKIYQQALEGSFNHQRLILEMAGEYVPGMNIKVSPETIEARFAELERKRVTARVIEPKALTSGTTEE